MNHVTNVGSPMHACICIMGKGITGQTSYVSTLVFPNSLAVRFAIAMAHRLNRPQQMQWCMCLSKLARRIRRGLN